MRKELDLATLLVVLDWINEASELQEVKGQVEQKVNDLMYNQLEREHSYEDSWPCGC